MLFLWIIIVTVLVETGMGRPRSILFDNIAGYSTDPVKNKTRTTEAPSGQIHFPTDFEESVNFASRITEVPKCANGLSFCEDVDFYPHDYLKKVLEDNRMLINLFGQDEVPKDDFSGRIEEEDEKFVCRSISRTIFPKIGQNKNNKWKFIINQGEEEGFVQGVQIEICKDVGGECDFPGSLPMGSGYQTFCKQKYVYRRLLSLSDGGMPVQDTFKIPSACCCAYKQNFDFLTRLGVGFSPATKKN